MSDELYVGMKAAMVAYLRYGADHYESSPDGCDALAGIAKAIESGDFEDVCLARPEVANGTYGNPDVHALRLLDDWSAIAGEQGPRWFCNCGHRATSADDHAAHVARGGGGPVTHGDPVLIRYHGSTPYEFHCGCGHIAESLQDHDAHLAQEAS